MSKLIDITGKKFNSLLVIKRVENEEKGRARWLCKCDCGNETIVRGSNLKNGAVKSCGCLRKTASERNRTHGDSRTKLYNHWVSMIYRCYNPKNQAYKWYGARGIKVCDEWKDYLKFKEWVLSTRPDESYTVERIDVNGDYCPENCKWIPMGEQANNRTTNLIYEYNGKKQNLAQWCMELGLDYKLVHNRLFKSKWSFEKAISTPVSKKKGR